MNSNLSLGFVEFYQESNDAPLINAVQNGTELLILTGEPDDRKESLRQLEHDLSSKNSVLISCQPQDSTFSQIIDSICQHLKLPTEKDRSSQIKTIKQYLYVFLKQGQSVVLIIDQADQLKADVFSRLLIFYHSMQSCHLPLHLVISGGPELARRVTQLSATHPVTATMGFRHFHANAPDGPSPRRGEFAADEPAKPASNNTATEHEDDPSDTIVVQWPSFQNTDLSDTNGAKSLYLKPSKIEPAIERAEPEPTFVMDTVPNRAAELVASEKHTKPSGEWMPVRKTAAVGLLALLVGVSALMIVRYLQNSDSTNTAATTATANTAQPLSVLGNNTDILESDSAAAPTFLIEAESRLEPSVTTADPGLPDSRPEPVDPSVTTVASVPTDDPAEPILDSSLEAAVDSVPLDSRLESTLGSSASTLPVDSPVDSSASSPEPADAESFSATPPLFGNQAFPTEAIAAILTETVATTLPKAIAAILPEADGTSEVARTDAADTRLEPLPETADALKSPDNAREKTDSELAVASFEPIASTIPVEEYIRMGKRMLELSDIVAARLYFEAGARAGDAQCMLAVGMTYDPVVLHELGLLSFYAQPDEATRWYNQALGAGVSEAGERLEILRNTHTAQ